MIGNVRRIGHNSARTRVSTAMEVCPASQTEFRDTTLSLKQQNLI